MTLLFIWSLITIPANLDLCTLWVSTPPSMVQWYQACPFLQRADQVEVYNMRDYFKVQFIDIKIGNIACEQPAQSLPELTCHLFPLDKYKIILIWHNSQSLVCGISVDHEGEPTNDELTNKCGMDVMHKYKTGQLLLRYFGTHEIQPPSQVVIYPPALTSYDLGDISTSKDYQVLAYNLNWYGIVDPLHLWQNQWDQEILAAARQTNVPPQLIKAIIGQESQFWPLWTGKQEVGLIQLTDDGADTVMRWNPGLFAIYCPRSILPSRCDYGYAILNPSEQQSIRDVFRSSLVLRGTPRQAAAKVRGDLIIYAEILLNYYEASAEAVAPIPPSWDYAIAAYHSGIECILSGSICPEGQKYLDEVMR
jgi:hypothetical protein